MKFPLILQFDKNDSALCCIQMLSKFYGKPVSIKNLKENTDWLSYNSLHDLEKDEEIFKFKCSKTRIKYDLIKKENILPCIIHWKQGKFVVLYKIKNSKYYIADPALGYVIYSKEEFLQAWQIENKKGECLYCEPTVDFLRVDETKKQKFGFRYLFSYIIQYKKFLYQLIFGLFLVSGLQMLIPLIAQSVVDVGINNNNYNFIILALAGQLIIYLSKSSVEFIRLWILLHVNSRISISLISDFLLKLMKLPLGFFDSKVLGDILQRINDHDRIERFLASDTLTIVFSLFNFLVFGILLAVYNIYVFLFFILGSGLYIIWILLFMKKRKSIDYKLFEHFSNNQSKVVQIIQGINDIRLNGREKQKRSEWERIQVSMFYTNIKRLNLYQYQHFGGDLINEIKNIIVTGITAFAVIDGNMTLGMMIAVQYIIGQLNSPLEEFILFLNSAQDAKISLDRLSEIHEKEDEEKSFERKLKVLPKNPDLKLENVSFKYEGSDFYALNEINLTIPTNKTTAIVGTSGSGKTTLVKLLLAFYKTQKGRILVNNLLLQDFNFNWWRSKCGAVMQDGYIYSESVAQNIAGNDEIINHDRLRYAVKVANLKEFINDLPLGFKTKIGEEGRQLSQGQKQRVLIARLVYKNPEFLFFDEATNALDANNEKIIMDNLNEFLENKTVVIVAHRLSTVKNADQIIVLEKGEMIEIGEHNSLIDKKGAYYNLVKNQLELGN